MEKRHSNLLISPFIFLFIVITDWHTQNENKRQAVIHLMIHTHIMMVLQHTHIMVLMVDTWLNGFDGIYSGFDGI